MPRGGKRVGSGRKPLTRRERWLGGNAGGRTLALVTPERRVEGVQPVSAPVATSTVTVDAPSVLTPAELKYWELWAPIATARGLLHQGTMPGFVLLCQWARKAEVFWSCIEDRGIEQETVTIDGSGQEHRTYKANSLLARWSDAMKRVEQLQARYGLAADGKLPVGAADQDAEEAALAQLLAVK